MLCHVPIASFDTAFNDVFAEWTKELNRMELQLMLGGHRHELYMFQRGESKIHEVTADFPVAVCSRIDKKIAETYVSAAIVIGEKTLTLRYTDMDHNVLEEQTVAL